MARKKAKPTPPEIVEHCDHCRKPLGRTCQRTNGSAACAAGCGVFVRRVESTMRFFCSEECKAKCNEWSAK